MYRGRQCHGKFLLRSTPCALSRVPLAAPSGFKQSMIQSRSRGGGFASISRRVTATPAVSVPWIQPTTSTERGAAGSPDSTTRIGRPKADRPASSLRCTGLGCARERAGKLLDLVGFPEPEPQPVATAAIAIPAAQIRRFMRPILPRQFGSGEGQCGAAELALASSIASSSGSGTSATS